MDCMPPDLPPRIDRASKPMRIAPNKSAQERLFGGASNGNGTATVSPKDQNDPPNYINATNHHRLQPNMTSLERHNSSATSIMNSNNKTVRIVITRTYYRYYLLRVRRSIISSYRFALIE